MIETLHYLPRPTAPHSTLAEQFGDLAPALTQRQAAIESARCLYCYDAPCTRICPSEIDVASFIRNIHEHNLNGAAIGILKQNILGGSCARVCPTEILCEHACVRNHDAEGQPVKIGLLQRHALDHMHFPSHPFTRAASTGKTIAIVGAGPAGLSCAHRLAMLGHDVVLFEAQEKAGGLNQYGIAKYKLAGDFAQEEVAFLLDIGGIELRCGQTLGVDVQLKELHASFDAVVLALGLKASRRLGLTGEDAPGLLAAVDYISALRSARDLSLLPLPRRVLVLGAGNTAIDMAVQMKRLGAQEVTLVYRRGWDEMSATRHEQDMAKAHQVRILTWARPQQVLLDDAGRVAGMRFESTTINDGNGAGAAFDIPADAIFKAIGQSLDIAVLAALEVSIDASDKIAVDAAFRTILPGVYAVGDCIAPGQDLTVQAVQHGKLAALAIHRELCTLDTDLSTSTTETASWPT